MSVTHTLSARTLAKLRRMANELGVSEDAVIDCTLRAVFSSYKPAELAAAIRLWMKTDAEESDGPSLAPRRGRIR